MEEQRHDLLMIGLPEAGKTSFVHAVDEVLQNPATDDSLRSHGLAQDRSYLEGDKEKFRGGEKLDHTSRTLQDPPPELLFEHPKTGLTGRLYLPDVNGEVFQDQWVSRKWTDSYREGLKKIAGVLLFVRADVPASNQELLGAMLTLPPDDRKEKPWDPKKASPQVQLVDVLQFIGIKGAIPRPLKVAVLISAWDTVYKPGNLQPRDPAIFLSREWPLLSQFLRANAQTFVTKIYGVSALGGTEDEMEELCKLPPQDRVKLVEGEQSSKDLTRPLCWLLGLD